MKKQDKIKLDSISNIDEGIIDAVTDKKIALASKLGAKVINPRKKLIAIASLAASLALMLSLLLVVIIPILSPTVPIYRGMTIRRDAAAPMAAQSVSPVGGSAILCGSSGNATVPLSGSNGGKEHKKDPHGGHDESLDHNIEEMVTVNVITDDQVKYYVSPGETFIIEIHIDNPRDYEIQSFTLNGKKYANYMFKEGSTMELLLLEVTAPNEPGYTEYTIDAIKYIDGTEIKDVDMSSADKSIKAGITYPAAPSATVTAQTILPTSIALTVRVSDPYALIGTNELAVYLTDGDKVVASQPLKVGESHVTFDNLTMSKTYEYGIVTAFDLVDGREAHQEWLLTNKLTTAGAFSIVDATPTQESITFEVQKIGEVGEITSVSLYDAATDLLVEMGDADTRAFEGLLSNHAYNLYVDFTYTVNGETVSDWVAIKGIKTVAKTAPVLTFGDGAVDQTSVTYDVSASDPDGILHVTSVEILKNGQAVKDNGTALSGKFEGLLSNNAYTVRVTYTYDLNDGQGVLTETVTKDITTVAKTAPTITFGEFSITDISVAGSYSITDPDAIGSVTSVEVRKNGAAIQSNAQYEIAFDGLEYYTDYSIAVTYTFDLNDGVGLRTQTATYDFNTAPHLAFKNCKIINTTAVSEGETIYMQVELDNPLGAIPSGVIVNGQEYNCAAATTPTKIFVEIVNNGQFEAGDTTLTVEKVYMTLDGKEYAVSATQNNSNTISIHVPLKKLKVIENFDLMVLENGEYVKRNYIYPNDTVYLLLSLMNETQYTIDSMTVETFGHMNSYDSCATVTVTNPTILANGDYLINVAPPSNWGGTEYKIKITYTSPDGMESASSTASTQKAYKLASEEVKEISSPDDLLHMNKGYYYKLTNDIDLDGINWIGAGFNGVFDGCGYSIKNMTRVGTVSSEEISSYSDNGIGLFRFGNGIIQNVNLENVTLILDHSIYAVYVGALIGCKSVEEEVLSIENCSVDSESVIIVTRMNVGAVGGLVGSGATITNSSNAADIQVIGENDPSFYVGGIAGYGTVEHCTNNGSISANSETYNNYYVGGIVGRGNATNCTNNGSISGDNAGGIVGGYGDAANCINNGSVSGDIVGGIAGDAYNRALENCINITSNVQQISGNGRGTITNCYTLGNNVTVEQLNSKSFYTDTLGWSEEIWNLDDLDIENGKYPTLKP